jgi:hypothetical protein
VDTVFSVKPMKSVTQLLLEKEVNDHD